MSRPWETIASEPTPDGPLELRRRGDDYLITIRGRVLMTSAAHRSEDALARLGCAGLRARGGVRVLIGGLGMGFTLRAALDELGPDAVVVVAELNAVVAAWCRGPLAELTSGAALEPRVTLEIVDVAALVRRVATQRSEPRFDAIVLDLYEGPQTHVRPNDPLYGPAAVVHMRDALRPDGVLAVWCENASAGFERSLAAAGLAFERHRVGHGGRVHLVYVARRSAKSRRQ